MPADPSQLSGREDHSHMLSGEPEAPGPARLLRWATLAGAALAAFVLRFLPSLDAVFGRGRTDFQEGDAWFHVRTLQNLLAHFPWRSGFDPYMRFPDGQNVPTGPAWDLLMGAVAWILGFGSPSPALAEHVAAWLPCVIGALFPVAAYDVARRLFGWQEGLFAAWWIAILPGGFLWVTHLGLADHHALEGMLALVAIDAYIAADAAVGRRRMWLAALAGALTGLFILTRSAGVFLPGMLAVVALLDASFARVLIRALPFTAILYLSGSPTLWAGYMWLALAAAAGVSAVTLAVDFYTKQRGAARFASHVRLVIGAVALVLLGLARQSLVASLWGEVKRYAGLGLYNDVGTVQELAPLLHSGKGSELAALFQQLGLAWLFAIPALLWLLRAAFRERRAPLTLFALWSLAMTTGVFLQLRMIIYYAPCAAILCGLASAGLVRAAPAGKRWIAGAALGCFVLGSIPFALDTVRVNASPTADWYSALAWMRENTPEPMGDPSAWLRLYDAPRPGERFRYPPSAYGVAAWWEYGYWIEYLAHRIPTTNGTQIQSLEVARAFVNPDSNGAVDSLEKLGARYVVVDPSLPIFGGSEGARMEQMVAIAGADRRAYVRFLLDLEHHATAPVPVFMPDYYRAMAIHLYLHNGEAVAGSHPWLFEVDSTNPDGFIWSSRFPSEPAAREYMAANPSRRFLLGCDDMGKSCVDLTAIAGVRQVYSSDPTPISHDTTIRAVKVFELSR
jgi:asparagine N-glycosylation enzyme membrane subunit Stt3